ncbi:hypothetical protein [Porphyromonas sp.]|uniref:hypothetical protein n=1 Tax=Porphyromonas sp. TaxID=1924944 RepID=UPI0026DAF098|nr:hypothetical protein [Porphyromonas sp.]MDO4771385.1 hypothetical protein [Porphyromonas sp.]
MNIRHLLISIIAFLTLLSCDKIDRHGGDMRPQVSFEALNLSIEQKKSVKIPVKIQTAPSQEIRLQYVTKGDEGIEADFEITPEVITFAPNKLTDTLVLTNKSERQDPSVLHIYLGDVPKGYRKGIVDFIRVELQGKRPQTISFAKAEDILFKERPYPVTWKDENGRNKRFRSPETYPIEIDTEGSTAVEGVHFTFPQGKHMVFKPGGPRGIGHLHVRALKHDPNANTIKIKIPHTAGVAGGAQGSIVIKITEPTDLSGTWMFDKFVNESDFVDTAGEVETEEIKKITGEEGDRLVITGTPGSHVIKPSFKGTLRHLFAGENTTRLERELFISGNTLYLGLKVDNINVNISPLSEKVRTAEIGFSTVKDEKTGEEYLYMAVYDLEPTHYFSKTYAFFAGPDVKFPMLEMPPTYKFKKLK